MYAYIVLLFQYSLCTMFICLSRCLSVKVSGGRWRAPVVPTVRWYGLSVSSPHSGSNMWHLSDKSFVTTEQSIHVRI